MNMTAIYTDAKQSLSPKKYADNHSMIIYAPPTPNHITVSRLYFLLHPRTLAPNKYVDKPHINNIPSLIPSLTTPLMAVDSTPSSFHHPRQPPSPSPSP